MVFLSHVMAELHQMALGVGLGGWSAIAGFHAAATRALANRSGAAGGV
jgi:hypothetical protein